MQHRYLSKKCVGVDAPVGAFKVDQRFRWKETEWVFRAWSVHERGKVAEMCMGDLMVKPDTLPGNKWGIGWLIFYLWKGEIRVMKLSPQWLTHVRCCNAWRLVQICWPFHLICHKYKWRIITAILKYVLALFKCQYWIGQTKSLVSENLRTLNSISVLSVYLDAWWLFSVHNFPLATLMNWYLKLVIFLDWFINGFWSLLYSSVTLLLDL